MAMFRQRRLKVNLLSFGGVRGFFFGTGPFIREASCFRQTNLHRLPGVNNKNTQREKKNTDEQKASSMFLFFFFLLRESASLVRQKKKKKCARAAGQTGSGGRRPRWASQKGSSDDHSGFEFDPRPSVLLGARRASGRSPTVVSPPLPRSRVSFLTRLCVRLCVCVCVFLTFSCCCGQVSGVKVWLAEKKCQVSRSWKWQSAGANLICSSSAAASGPRSHTPWSCPPSSLCMWGWG